MKLEGKSRSQRLERASSVLERETDSIPSDLDTGKRLGEGYGRELLNYAEGAFRTGYEDKQITRGSEDLRFDGGLTYLATYVALFPQKQLVARRLLEKYKVKEKLEHHQWLGTNFLSAMILFPELKPQMVAPAQEVYKVLFKADRLQWATGDEFANALEFVSVDPEVLKTILTHIEKKELFEQFNKIFKEENWRSIIRFGGALHVCFPNEFVVPKFSPEQWVEMVERTRTLSKMEPELGLLLAILSAEQPTTTSGGLSLGKEKRINRAVSLPERLVT